VVQVRVVSGGASRILLLLEIITIFLPNG
jgi:hypothetical protein